MGESFPRLAENPVRFVEKPSLHQEPKLHSSVLSLRVNFTRLKGFTLTGRRLASTCSSPLKHLG